MTEKLIRKVWIAVSAAILWGCGDASSYTAVDGVMLGTTLHITADVQGVSAQELYAAAMELDREAKASMSIFDPGSLLSRLNRNETDSVDRHIAFNLHLADSIGALSGGRYDVTVKPLVEAWGFAGRQAERHPDVDSILAFVGREKVRVEEGRLVKADPRVQLDFNSIAKGYTVDLLARLVESFGARNYIVDIGGEVRCKGVNRQGGPWRIGIETPFDGNMSDGEYVQKRIRLTDGGDDERIDIVADIDWKTPDALLKAEFPMSVSAEEAVYDIGIGNQRRPTNHQRAHETFAHHWADLSDGDYGIAVLNDSKYGWGKPPHKRRV